MGAQVKIFTNKKNTMSKLLIGSICLTDLLEQAKKAHSACSRAKNGKAYVALQIWINDTPDQYGNTVSIQLNSTKEKKESEGKIYIGNAKDLTKPETVKNETQNNIPETENGDGLPF